MIGVVRALRGKVQVTWEPERSSKPLKSSDKTKTAADGRRRTTVVMLFLFLALYLCFTTLSLISRMIAQSVFTTSAFLIIYGYAGYPLILTLLTEFKKKRVNKREIYPAVSLVIPAHNEEDVIEDKIKNSLSLDYPRDKLRIIISSDGSSDGTNRILRKYEGKGIIANYFSPRSGKISVLNRTLAKIKSEIVVFSDANVMYNPDVIKKLVRNFRDNSVGGVSGRVVLTGSHGSLRGFEELYYRYERFIQRKETEFESLLSADGAMYAIRREFFDPPPDDTILDDFVIPMGVIRSGYRVVFEPEAVGYEKGVPSLKHEFNRRSRIVAGAVQMILRGNGVPKAGQVKIWFQFLSHKLLRWITPFLLIGLFLANMKLLMMEIRFGFYHIAAIFQGAFYLAALLGVFLKVHVFSVPTSLCVENAASILGFFKGMFNRQPVMWKVSR